MRAVPILKFIHQTTNKGFHKLHFTCDVGYDQFVNKCTGNPTGQDGIQHSAAAGTLHVSKANGIRSWAILPQCLSSPCISI